MFVDTITMKHELTTFTKIYNSYSDEVLKYAYSLCRDSDEAKDITSDVFIKLWGSKKPVIVETVRAYLYTITRNHFLKKQRSQRDNVKLHDSLVDNSPPPDLILNNPFDVMAIMNAMDSFNEVDKSIFFMKVNDMSYKEISSVTGVSISAIKVKVHRVRLNISKLMKEMEL